VTVEEELVSLECRRRMETCRLAWVSLQFALENIFWQQRLRPDQQRRTAEKSASIVSRSSGDNLLPCL